MIPQELIDRMIQGERTAWLEHANLCIQEALKSLPLANEYIMKQSAVLHEKSQKFYEQNSDLNEHRVVVAKVVQQIEAENPGMDMDIILEIAAERARQLLRETKKIKAKEPSRIELTNLDKVIGKL